jgi:hypothetical protein
MPELVCKITRWIDDEPQPGIVEAVFVDANGRQWTFIDKWPFFFFNLQDFDFPKDGVIRCEILEVTVDQSGHTIYRVSTELCAVEGDQFEFEVVQDQLVSMESERTSS